MAHLDRWHKLGCVQFVFGLDLTAAHHIRADELPKTAWKTLKRPARYSTDRRRPFQLGRER